MARIKYAKDVKYEFDPGSSHLGIAPDTVLAVRMVRGKASFGSMYESTVDRMLTVLHTARDKMNAVNPKASATCDAYVDEDDILWVWVDRPETRPEWTARIKAWFRRTNKLRVQKATEGNSSRAERLATLRVAAGVMGFDLVERPVPLVTKRKRK